MALDGIVLRALTHELNCTLTEGRIDKINQPEQDELIFQIHKNREAHRLLINVNSAAPRVCLTQEKRENPKTAPLLCMLLRKHLSGGRVLSIEQQGLDRILTLDIECRDEMGYPTANRLHVELMGKHSNMVFYNKTTGRIIDCIHRISESMSRVRQIHPGLLFEALPTSKINFMGLSSETVLEHLEHSKGKNLSGAILECFEGFSPLFCRELLFRASLEDEPRDNWTPTVLKALTAEIMNLGTLLQENRYAPTLIRSEKGSPEAFSAFPMTHLLKAGMTAEPFESISALLEAFYGEKSREARVKGKSMALRKLLGTRVVRLEKKLQKLQEDFYFAENADESRILGDLLTGSIYLVSKGMNEITVTDYFQEDQPQRTIPLDVRLTPSENAQRFYRKYNKLKTAQTEVTRQIAEAREELTYLDAVLTSIDTSREPSDIEQIQEELAGQGYIKAQKKGHGGKKQKDTFKPLLFKSPEGFEILVGRNNLENDRLTLKTASNSDLWLHTKEIPGSHVIIRAQGQEVPEPTLALAARIAAWHSKGRQGENVPVDCTLVRHVRKPAGARPGMVIYDHQRTLFVTPVEDELKSCQQ